MKTDDYNEYLHDVDPLRHPRRQLTATEVKIAMDQRSYRKPSNLVELETVGLEAYHFDPLARAAVKTGLAEDEFIRILLDDRKKLQELLRHAISLCPGIDRISRPTKP